ncbi:MAG: peptidoglycan DD-metalloendopeptidase family protein [Actinomycetota bacterium]|nr:peptidoglycan DD-metalloendopeptidase family protein [Actinomycetota bacterium]
MAQVRQQQLQEQLQAAADELAALQARTAEFEARRDDLARQLSALQIQLSDSQVRLDDRVRRLYVRGETSPAVMLLSAESPTAAMERAAIAARLIRDDRAIIQQVTAQRKQLEAVSTRFGQQQQALDEAFRRQQEVSTGLQKGLEEAAAVIGELQEEERQEEEARLLERQRLEGQRLEEQRRLDEQRRREEAERRRAEEEQRQRAQVGQRQPEKIGRVQPPAVPRPKPTPPPRPSVGGGRAPEGRYVCPMVRPRTFSDTWGAPRSGGRRHQGTDIFAPHGADVVAIVNGVVDQRGYGASAGWWLMLRGDDGTSYWYLHLQRYAVADGARVSAGQQIGSNGDTGNAQGTPPHVHFEQHPGGGAAVNPYPLLRRVCG